MLSAKKKLPHRRGTTWTAELGVIIYKLRYFRLLLRRTRGIVIHDTVVHNMATRAKETTTTTDEVEIKKTLRANWNKLNEYLKEVEKNREKFLEDLLTQDELDSPTAKAETLHKIKQREKMKWRYHKIRKVLKRLKSGGLTSVDIPVYDDDGNIQGWESVTADEELH